MSESPKISSRIYGMVHSGQFNTHVNLCTKSSTDSLAWQCGYRGDFVHEGPIHQAIIDYSQQLPTWYC